MDEQCGGDSRDAAEQLPLGPFSTLGHDVLLLILSMAGLFSLDVPKRQLTLHHIDIVLLLRLLRTAKSWCAVLEPCCLLPVLNNAFKEDDANIFTATAATTFDSRQELFNLIKHRLVMSNTSAATTDINNGRKTYHYSAAISFLQLAQLEARDRGHLISMASREMYHTGRPFRESPCLRRIFCYATGLEGLPPEFQNKRVTMDLSSGQVPGLRVVNGMSHHDVALAMRYEEICRVRGRPSVVNRSCACGGNDDVSTECKEHWALQRAAIYADMMGDWDGALLLVPERPYAQFCDIVILTGDEEDNQQKQHHIFSNACDEFRARCFHCTDALRSDERRRHQAIVLAYEHKKNHEVVKRVCNDIVVWQSL